MSRTDMKRDSEKRFRSKFNRKHWRNTRLRELEKQLEFAESRCGTLKQQLDYVKVLYGCGKQSLRDNEEISEPYDEIENVYMSSDMRRINFDVCEWNNVAPDFGDQQNGEKCFLPQSISYTNTTRASTNSSNKLISSKSSFEKKEMMNEDGKDSAPQKSKVNQGKGKRKKAENSKNKIKNEEAQPRYSNTGCQTSCPVWQDPIVEIYKNASANVRSESAAEISHKYKRQKLDNLNGEPSKTMSGKCKKGSDSSELIPATKLKAFTSFKSLDKVNIVKEEGVQTENKIQNENEKCSSSDFVKYAGKNLEKTFYIPEKVKSYCQPTISSRKKRVERSFLTNLNNLNLKNIPFIAATSTAPSHNIGVNIQQVLSIMKKRQPNGNNDILPILSDQLIGEIGRPVSSGVTVHGANVAETNSIDFTAEITQTDSKKPLDGSKSNLIEKKLSGKVFLPFKAKSQEEMTDENENPDWICKVHRLKKVLVFLHEDFTSLSHKYKRLQKKLFNRNINKLDAKGELAEIERDLEKKEEEITIIIGLYKEVLQLREEVKIYQEKYNLVLYERSLMMDGLKQSNSTHAQMSVLLRKIQQFQDRLKL